MANQLHYSVDHTQPDSITPVFFSLPTDHANLIDDCFDEAIAKAANHTVLNDVA